MIPLITRAASSAAHCSHQCAFMGRVVRSPYVWFGSITSFWGDADDFRSTPMNGHLQSRSACLKRAMNRHPDEFCWGILAHHSILNWNAHAYTWGASDPTQKYRAFRSPRSKLLAQLTNHIVRNH